MDNIRFALLCALGVLGFMLYQAWQADYPSAPAHQEQQQQATSGAQGSNGEHASGFDMPPESGRNDDQAASGATVTTPSNNGKALAHGRTIRVVTDEMNVAIDTHGGDLRNIALLEVPVSADDSDSPLYMINHSPPNFFIVQCGLSVDSSPNHDSTFQAAQDTYRMAPDQDVL